MASAWIRRSNDVPRPRSAPSWSASDGHSSRLPKVLKRKGSAKRGHVLHLVRLQVVQIDAIPLVSPLADRASDKIRTLRLSHTQGAVEVTVRCPPREEPRKNAVPPEQ